MESPDLTLTDLVILASALNRCLGWDNPPELYRFRPLLVGCHIDFAEQEMEQAADKLADLIRTHTSGQGQVREALEYDQGEIIAVKGCMPCVGMIDLTRPGLITLNADQFVRLPAGTLPLPPRAAKDDA